MRNKPAEGRTIVVGLTGGIASGKTLVADAFRKLGAQVIESDRISRDLSLPGTPVYRQIVRAFGCDILREDGAIDRRKLGTIVFGDPDKRKVLERITHPAIIRRLERQVAAYRKKKAQVLVIDLPLLFESGLERLCDVVVVVWVPKRVQMQRLALRDRLSPKEIRWRLKAQWPLGQKKKRADFVINNGGDRNQTRGEVKKVWQVLTKFL